MRLMTQAAGALAAPVARTAQRMPAQRSGVTMLGWHRFGDAPDGLTTTIEDFEAQLDALSDWGATVLPLATACRLLERGPLPDRAVVLTLDDGYASAIEQAWPILRDRNLPATLFAVSGYLDGNRRFLWDQANRVSGELARIASSAALVEAANDGLEIGSHTVTHRWLPELSDRALADEVTRSREKLEQLLGRPVRTFAYPMGGWTPLVREAVREAGYDAAVTVDRGRNHLEHDRLALRRAFAFDRPADFRRQLDGGFTWMRPIERRRNRKAPRW